MLVFPTAASNLRPMVFNMSLRGPSVGRVEAVARRFVVAARGSGGSRVDRAQERGLAVRLGARARLRRSSVRASSRLSSSWLLFPIALLVLGAILVPLTILGLERWRSRKATRLRSVETSSLEGHLETVARELEAGRQPALVGPMGEQEPFSRPRACARCLRLVRGEMATQRRLGFGSSSVASQRKRSASCPSSTSSRRRPVSPGVRERRSPSTRKPYAGIE